MCSIVFDLNLNKHIAFWFLYNSKTYIVISFFTPGRKIPKHISINGESLNDNTITHHYGNLMIIEYPFCLNENNNIQLFFYDEIIRDWEYYPVTHMYPTFSDTFRMFSHADFFVPNTDLNLIIMRSGIVSSDFRASIPWGHVKNIQPN